MKTNRRFLKSFLGGAVTVAAMSILLSVTAFAMNVSVSFTDPSAEVGEDVTVSMHILSDSGEALGSANIMLNYDASVLEFVSGDNAEGGAGSLHISGQATTDAKEWYYGLHFKALTGGTAKIEVATAEIYDADAKIATISHQGSSAVTVGAAAQESEAEKPAALNALSISPGTLSPVFSPEQSSYTAVVGDEVTRIAVSAVPAAEGARITVSGNESLELGENTISVQVNSADGAELGSYTITVTKQEGVTPAESAAAESSALTIDGKSYEIADSFDTTLLPAGYTTGSYSFKGRTVLAGTAPDNKLHIMYLLAEGGSGDLFLYDESSDSWAPYVEVGMSARAVTAVPLGADVQVPEELVSSRLNLNGKSVEGWIGAQDQGQNYCVFYGMNAEGEKSFYRFDLSEKTIQRYFDEAAGARAEKDAVSEELHTLHSLYRRRTIMMFVMFFVALAAVIAASVLALQSRHGEKRSAVRKDSVSGGGKEEERSDSDHLFADRAKDPKEQKAFNEEALEEIDFAETAENEIDEAQAGQNSGSADDDFQDIEL